MCVWGVCVFVFSESWCMPVDCLLQIKMLSYGAKCHFETLQLRCSRDLFLKLSTNKKWKASWVIVNCLEISDVVFYNESNQLYLIRSPIGHWIQNTLMSYDDFIVRLNAAEKLFLDFYGTINHRPTLLSRGTLKKTELLMTRGQ